MGGGSKLVLTFAVVMVIALIAWSAEAVRDSRPALFARGWLAVIAAALAVLLVALTAHFAHARDLERRYAASPLKPWFDSLRSGKGPCCSDADGYAISDADWDFAGGHYRVRIPRSNDPAEANVLIWVEVPEDALISEPNRAGRTMVWPIWGHQGPTIRCFMPGSMT